MHFNLNNIPSQRGKVAIVTGANNGVGFETASGLAKVGCKVVMACRSLDRAEEARNRILSRIPEADLDIILLDLSDQNSVTELAEGFAEKFSVLNILINNAGVLDYSRRKNEEGLELQFATNHLGHFLLTSLLIDLMPDDSSSRVVSLSSIAHKQGKIDFEDINCERQTDKAYAYAQSKLACLMFSDELQRRLEKGGRKILSLCAHPGGTDSGLFDDMSRVQYIVLKILSPFITHSNKSAAQPSLVAALKKEIKGGDYYGPQGFMDLKGPPGIAKRTQYSKDLSIASELWEVSLKMTNASFPCKKPTY